MKNQMNYYTSSRILALFFLIFGCCSGTYGPVFAQTSSIKIMTHNVYMINPPLGISAAPNRQGRARLIAQANYIRGNDIVILNELFDNAASDIIMNGLRSAYPHQTPVAGRSQSGWDGTQGEFRPSDRLEAGVAVLSKWPIEEKIQYLFRKSDLCGWDAWANKGFIYTRIRYKNNQKIHLIATHAQAADSGCEGKSVGFAYGSEERERSFRIIRNFLLSKGIPRNELVFISGDLNVIKGTTEFNRMLSVLNAQDAIVTGHNATYDPKNNSLISEKNLQTEVLDYVLVSKDFGPTGQFYNHITRPRSSSGDYADHYPVVGSFVRQGQIATIPRYRDVASSETRVADCPSGYTNNGLTCGRGADNRRAPSRVANCPSGYTNTGLTCFRGASTYSKGCTTIFKKFPCKSGYTDMGCFCAKGASSLGTGSMSCPSGYFLNKGLGRCYKTCPSGYTNTGEFCHRPVSTKGDDSMICKPGEQKEGPRCRFCPSGYELSKGVCYKT